MAEMEETGQAGVNRDEETGDWYVTFICAKCGDDYEISYSSRALAAKAITKRTFEKEVFCLGCIPTDSPV